MLRDIPSSVQQAVQALLETKGKIELHDFFFSAGGCINHAGRLRTSSGDFFLKWNDAARLPAMFEAESSGLQLLKRANSIDIPDVIGFGAKGNYQFLVLEFVKQSTPSKQYWEKLGHQLADLHRVRNDFFGLDHSNYIGSLHQYNKPNASWVSFFIEQRLSIQVKLAADSGLMEYSHVKSFESFYNKLQSIIPEESPALLHGDLWSGNVLVNEKGNPCLIDPAVYYGSREVDLAMTRLFDVFCSGFYSSYEESYPLAPGHAHRMDIYNLYYLLVHLNLFGPAYLNKIIATLRKFA